MTVYLARQFADISATDKTGAQINIKKTMKNNHPGSNIFKWFRAEHALTRAFTL
jgi:hypothetical protein